MAEQLIQESDVKALFVQRWGPDWVKLFPSADAVQLVVEHERKELESIAGRLRSRWIADALYELAAKRAAEGDRDDPVMLRVWATYFNDGKW